MLFIYLGNNPQHQKEKSVDVNKGILQAIFHPFTLLDSTRNERFSNGLSCLPNEKQRRSTLSNTFIISHQEFVLENCKFVNKTFYNLLLLDSKTTSNELKKTQYIDELKISQTIPVVNISYNNSKYHDMNIFNVALSDCIDEGAKPVPENENDIWNNVATFENHLKNSYKNILKNYTRDKAKRLLYNMKPTKSSLFQYFSSTQPLVLNSFYTTPEFHQTKEEDVVLEKEDFQTNQLFDALRIAPSYEILIGTSNFDERIMVSSNAVLLEGSFTISEAKRNIVNEDNFFQVSSLNIKEDSISLGATPVMSMNDYSENSGSSSESVSEIDDSTDSQIFMSSCYEHSSSPLVEATFASFLHSRSIYRTSPVSEHIVTSTFSSYVTFDEVS